MSSAVPLPTDLPSQSLALKRGELDRIDDALHDLLMQRAEVVAAIGALRAKDGVALRPGREASILRRLLRRNHGSLAAATVVRVWRAILNGSTAQQEAMRVAAPPGLEAVAREHLGAEVSIVAAADEAAAIAAVGAGSAALAVLRWPGDWWMLLLEERAMAVHVVARLPFWRQAGPEAMLLSPSAPDPSGDDRSLIAAPVDGEVLRAALAGQGLAVLGVTQGRGSTALAEVEGFVPETALRAVGQRARVVGAYAVPVGGRS